MLKEEGIDVKFKFGYTGTDERNYPSVTTLVAHRDSGVESQELFTKINSLPIS